MTTNADKKSQRIADQAERQQAQRVEVGELGKTILQIAKSIHEDAGTISTRKVMACKLLSAQYKLSISNWCKHAGISRPTWYAAVARPNFGEASVDLVNKIYDAKLLEVFAAFIHKAIHGGQDGMGDSQNQHSILRQKLVLDKEETGLTRYSDDELRRIARQALGFTDDNTKIDGQYNHRKVAQSG